MLRYKIWKTPVNYVEKKYNWLYKLTLKQDPRYYYIGSHSSNIEPEKDPYMGSGRGLKEYKAVYGKNCFAREILSYWPTKEELLLEEARVVTLDMVKDPFCLNRAVGGGTLNTAGTTHTVSAETRRKISTSQKGRKFLSEWKEKARQSREQHGPYPRSEKQKHCMDKYKGVPRPAEVWEKIRETRKQHGPYYQSEASKEKNRAKHQGKCWIRNGECCKTVWPSELPEYLDSGWTRGRIVNKGKRVWITNGVEHKYILQAEEQNYLDRGWKRGKLGKTTEGRIWIVSPEDRCKLIFPDQFEEFERQGWKKGVNAHRKEVFNRKGKYGKNGN